ncbi:hypothetical protein ACWCQB_16515 [Streptomyces hirsutus]
MELMPSATTLIPKQSTPPVGSGNPDAETDIPGFEDLLATLEEAGLAKPELDSEVSDPHTGAAVVVAAAYWPQGLQKEVGTPVVLAPDITKEEQAALEAGDYRLFHSADSLRRFIDNLHMEQMAG